MPDKCLLCGAAGSSCGTPTVSVAVDTRVTGYKVAGDKVVTMNSDTSAVLGDMTEEEREEFRIINESRERRRLRRVDTNVEGPAAHTSLTYVRRADGVITKMAPDLADKYVELNPGAEIVREGAMPIAKEGEIIGATKARVGAMFGDDGRQLVETQPFTTRSFSTHDMTREEVHTPALGATGTHIDNDASTGSSSGSASASASTPKATKPATAKPAE